MCSIRELFNVSYHLKNQGDIFTSLVAGYRKANARATPTLPLCKGTYNSKQVSQVPLNGYKMKPLYVFVVVLFTVAGIKGAPTITLNEPKPPVFCKTGYREIIDNVIITGSIGPITKDDFTISKQYTNLFFTGDDYSVCQVLVGPDPATVCAGEADGCHCDSYNVTTKVANVVMFFSAFTKYNRVKFRLWSQWSLSPIESNVVYIQTTYGDDAANLTLYINSEIVDFVNLESCGAVFQFGEINTIKMCCHGTVTPCKPIIGFNTTFFGDAPDYREANCVSRKFNVTKIKPVNVNMSYILCNSSTPMVLGSCFVQINRTYKKAMKLYVNDVQTKVVLSQSCGQDLLLWNENTVKLCCNELVPQCTPKMWFNPYFRDTEYDDEEFCVSSIFNVSSPGKVKVDMAYSPMNSNKTIRWGSCFLEIPGYIETTTLRSVTYSGKDGHPDSTTKPPPPTNLLQLQKFFTFDVIAYFALLVIGFFIFCGMCIDSKKKANKPLANDKEKSVPSVPAKTKKKDVTGKKADKEEIYPYETAV